MVHSPLLAASAIGGALQRTILQTLFPATCSPPVAPFTEASTIRLTDFLFVASGINLFDLFTPPQRGRKILNLALFSDLPVYKATYDLLLAIFGFTKDFSKSYK